MKSYPQKYLGFEKSHPPTKSHKKGPFFSGRLAPENRVAIGFIEGLELCSKELTRGIGP